ncbi:MAG: nicotinamide-nucleotide adenylyltransferase [Thermoplasmatales archaeon]|nr:MAG: nicotinamide-nucleotide adenylyltransferase [Thermoplasmatales archaeon]
MKALFIGRFQPFHKGHLKIIEDASKIYSEIIIGIGSSQYSNTNENPFTNEERKQMIENSLKKISIKNYKVVNIPDIHNPPKWVDHVLTIVSDFDVVLSNNDFTRELFSDKGYVVKETPLYEKDKYSGKVIRYKIKNNETWEDFVPEEVFKFIKKSNAIERIRNLQ